MIFYFYVRVFLLALIFSLFSLPAYAQSQAIHNTQTAIYSLLTLIVQRLLLADQIALAKWQSGEDYHNQKVENKAQETKILQKIQSDSAVTQSIQQFFQDQMDASKVIQHILLNIWQENQLAPTENKPNLDRIRKEIGQLNIAIVAILKKLQQRAQSSTPRLACLNQMRNILPHLSATYALDTYHQAALLLATRSVCDLTKLA